MPGANESLSFMPATERAFAPAPQMDRLIEQLKWKYSARVTGELIVPAVEARYADFPEALAPSLRAALAARSIARPYSHQREAWDRICAGRHTVVVTPTASGKTLCYNVPVLDAAVRDKAKALYLFPTKALSQDQVA